MNRLEQIVRKILLEEMDKMGTLEEVEQEELAKSDIRTGRVIDADVWETGAKIKRIPVVVREPKVFSRVRVKRRAYGSRTFSNKKMKEIKEFVKDNSRMTYEEIAKHFGVTAKQIGHLMLKRFGIRRYKPYKHRRRVVPVTAKTDVRNRFLETLGKEIETAKKVKQINKTNKKSQAMRKYWSSPKGQKAKEKISVGMKEWWEKHPKARERQSELMRKRRGKFKDLWDKDKR